MSLTWHNWFFASFDPGGFVSVDKPPLGFWIQLVSVWLFGFHGSAVILPQALAGVLSVGVLYLIVRSFFGGSAALIGALALALSPINVVANRDNTLESLLVLAILLAALAVTKAMERASLRWLLVGAVLIGLGFNIKMLEAYLVVPALAGAYALSAPVSWRARILHLLAAGALMLLVSGAWITAVELTPAAHRPYVGSSYHNSALDLVFSYNGLQRLTGTPWSHEPAASSATGAPGPFRLITSDAASQVSWWFPLDLLPLITFFWHPRHALALAWRNRRVTAQQGALILWGAWLLTMIVVFSQAVFMNVYYLALLAPASAALAGIGLATLWSAMQAGRWQKWLLLGGLAGTVGEQGLILSHYQTWNAWVMPVVGVLTGCAASTLLIVEVARQLPQRTRRIARNAAALFLAVSLSLAPVLWTYSSLHPDEYGGFPASGPPPGNGNDATAPAADPYLIAYLQHHRAGASFLAATVDADAAVPIIFSTGAPVMALGGYTGYDPILTPATLAEAVHANEVRFFYIPSSNLTLHQAKHLYPQVADALTHYTNGLTQWVAQRCRAVPPGEWSATDGLLAASRNSMQLFDCSALVKGETG
jgi:4-amino-4-deoxy-L-arabinose transferase-like glycosyltransferase